MIEVVFKHCTKESILSEAGVAQYILRKYDGTPPIDFMVGLIPRNDIVLLDLVKQANPDFVPPCADVRIAELPDGSSWSVQGGGRFPEWVAING